MHCTPDYVSPEAATGEATLDIRSDFYSLGATFYRLLAGHNPFRGKSAEDVIIQRLENPPPKLSEDAGVSENFSDVIFKLMQYEKSARFQNIEELREALERCLQPVEKQLKIKKFADV